MRAIETIQLRFRKVGNTIDRRLWRVLWEAVEALVRGGDMRPAVMARYLRRAAFQKHRIKTVDRLLGNPRLRRVFRPLYQAIARMLIRNARSAPILVDWTQIDTKHNAIVAAVPIGGRGIPLLSHVHRKAKVPTRAMHRKFLKELGHVLPPDCVPILITDAGFQGSWLADVAAHNWHYVARVRHRTCVRAEASQVWLPNKQLHVRARAKPRDLGHWQIGKDRKTNRLLVRLLLAKRTPRGRHYRGRRGKPLRGGKSPEISKRQREPWLLATNLTASASFVVEQYARRMQIEETFRDAKNPLLGWSLGAVRSRHPERLAALMMIATLAYLCVIVVGLAAENSALHRQLQANTLKRRVLSLFRLGTVVLTTLCAVRVSAADLHNAIRRLQTLVPT